MPEQNPSQRQQEVGYLVQQQIERNTHYAYWFSNGRRTPGGWAAIAILAICAAASLTPIVGASAGRGLPAHSVIFLALASVAASIARSGINRLIRTRLLRQPRALREFERAWFPYRLAD